MMMIMIMMMMMVIIIIIIIIIITIISLRNYWGHHSYISKPNIRTIKSRKINLGDKFYIWKKQEIALD